MKYVKFSDNLSPNKTIWPPFLLTRAHIMIQCALRPVNLTGNVLIERQISVGIKIGRNRAELCRQLSNERIIICEPFLLSAVNKIMLPKFLVAGKMAKIRIEIAIESRVEASGSRYRRHIDGMLLAANKPKNFFAGRSPSVGIGAILQKFWNGRARRCNRPGDPVIPFTRGKGNRFDTPAGDV
ncbi:hypothetical protein L286_23210 [Sphingobium sp. HDIP04]|nr:hypothetical protein L286_23210 [Sphingobium sp. HDIP04]